MSFPATAGIQSIILSSRDLITGSCAIECVLRSAVKPRYDRLFSGFPPTRE
ncbi:MAG TPA: palindromic element RPE4 domain-containing protein [Rickettsia endosymbiont of Degeeriella rufa]|nr:palindromic element RPE4 domain-containing protein [Rickettsia endosymbiont of Degeeriella rufa]